MRLVDSRIFRKDDFIEIYNAGETDVNIAGWYISDIPSSPAAFQIPATDLTKTLIPETGELASVFTQPRRVVTAVWACMVKIPRSNNNDSKNMKRCPLFMPLIQSTFLSIKVNLFIIKTM